MNIQEYISSGIVESYALGLAEPAERAEFERMCNLHPEVLAARLEFENSLEEFATMNPIIPPANLKSRIFASIDIENTQAISDTSAPVADHREPFTISREPAKVRSMNWQRYLAAAAVALLLVSTALNFYFFNKYREYGNRYEALVLSQSELASHNQVLQTRLVAYEDALGKMKDPNMAVIKMPAAPNSPDPLSATTVYWDKSTKDVYLAVNKLPSPSESQQYQLWALVDGVPVDAGVFEMGDAVAMVKMKNIPKAQAFAITLEKKGGSAKPTMEKLYVMGKV